MKIGQTSTNVTGRDFRAAVDAIKTKYKIGGVTFDLTTITSVGPATLADGQIIPSGVKYLKYGTVIAKITASGKYGPADLTAADGRQTITTPGSRGRVFILDRTFREDIHGDNTGEVFDAGVAWRSRISLAGNADGDASITALGTGLPQVSYLEN